MSTVQWPSMFDEHEVFETKLLECFSPEQAFVPSPKWVPRTQLEHQVKSLISGRRWTETIGWRLVSADLDFSFPSWLKYLPLETLQHVVPANLLCGSLMMDSDRAYSEMVFEAFILPLDVPRAESTNLSDALSLEADLDNYSECRQSVYEFFDPRQRHCVGDYLNLWLKHNPNRFDGAALEHAHAVRNMWWGLVLPNRLFDTDAQGRPLRSYSSVAGQLRR